MNNSNIKRSSSLPYICVYLAQYCLKYVFLMVICETLCPWASIMFRVEEYMIDKYA